jgi:hypothetical protein
MSSEFRGCRLGGDRALSEESIREEGFTIFKEGTVRRLSPTHYVVKSQAANSWRLVELKDAIWVCDCNSSGAPCPHAYSVQLHRYATKEKAHQLDESRLKCRYCSSIDIAGCGFRYGARGISRRYFCRDCQRKFSIPYVNSNPDSKPNDIAWLLNELGMLVTQLTRVIAGLNEKLDHFSSCSTLPGTSDFASQSGASG